MINPGGTGAALRPLPTQQLRAGLSGDAPANVGGVAEPFTIPRARLIETLENGRAHEGAADAANPLRHDPREFFEARELDLDEIRRTMLIRQEHLRNIGKRRTGFDDFVASLDTWEGPLHSVVIMNTADADIGIYADLSQARLAGCVVSTPAWVRPDREPDGNPA
jgi:hypothetical protein